MTPDEDIASYTKGAACIPVYDHRAADVLSRYTHREDERERLVHEMQQLVTRAIASLTSGEGAKPGNKISARLELVHFGDGWDVRLHEPSKGDVREYDLGFRSFPALRRAVGNPATLSDVLFSLAHRPGVGGNGTNFALTQMSAIRALHHLNGSLGSQIRVPEKTIFTPDGGEFHNLVHDLSDRYAGWLKVVDLQGVDSRSGLHIPFTNEAGNLDTFMINTRPPDRRQIGSAMHDTVPQLLPGSEVVTPDHLPGLTDRGYQQSLLPTSAALDTLDPEMLRSSGVFVNDRELTHICRGIPDLQREELLPDVLQDGCVSQAGLAETSRTIRALWGSVDAGDVPRARRVATIGKRAGGGLAVYRDQEGLIALETTLMEPEAERRAVHMLDATDAVDWDLEQTTGRGDSAAAASILDAVSGDVLRLACSNAMAAPQLSPEQRRIAELLLPELAARAFACFVHHSPDSHLLQVPPERLSRIILELAEQAVECAECQDRLTREPVVMRSRWGVDAVQWRV